MNPQTIKGLKLALKGRLGLAMCLEVLHPGRGWHLGAETLAAHLRSVNYLALSRGRGLDTLLADLLPPLQEKRVGAMLSPAAGLEDPRALDRLERRGGALRRGLVLGAGFMGREAPPDALVERSAHLLSRCVYAGVRGPETAAILARTGWRPDVVGDPILLRSRPPGSWRPRRGLVALGLPGRLELDQRPELAGLVGELLALWRADRVPFMLLAADRSIPDRLAATGLDLSGAARLLAARQDPETCLEALAEVESCLTCGHETAALAASAQVPLVALESNLACRDLVLSLGAGEWLRPAEGGDAATLAGALGGTPEELADRSRLLAANGAILRNKLVYTAARISHVHRYGVGRQAWERPLVKAGGDHVAS